VSLCGEQNQSQLNASTRLRLATARQAQRGGYNGVGYGVPRVDPFHRLGRRRLRGLFEASVPLLRRALSFEMMHVHARNAGANRD
jgi:hypothetical protein